MFLGARDKSRGEAAAKALQASGEKDSKLDVRFVLLDVTSADSIEAARKYIADTAGSCCFAFVCLWIVVLCVGRLDILVNNAGRLPDMKATSVVDAMRSCYEVSLALLHPFVTFL